MRCMASALSQTCQSAAWPHADAPQHRHGVTVVREWDYNGIYHETYGK